MAWGTPVRMNHHGLIFLMPQQGMWHEKTAEKINNLLRGRCVFLCDYSK